jgi:NhaP-type Na+/H+ or K+/H+ antiporter
LSENFIYFYIGAVFWFYLDKLSIDTVYLLLAVIALRMLTSLSIGVILAGISKYRRRSYFSWNDLVIFIFTGMIRGTVSFALISQLEEDNEIKSSVIVTIIVTNFIFGGGSDLLARKLLMRHQKVHSEPLMPKNRGATYNEKYFFRYFIYKY